MVKKIFKRIIILLLFLIAVVSILLVKYYIDSFRIKFSWGYDYQKTAELQKMDIDFILDNKKVNFKNPIYIKDSCFFA